MLIAWGKWFHRNEGSTAIEFSLLALPFMLTVLAIIELCIFFAASTALQGAVGDASRPIRTGQLQSADDALAEFRTILCIHASVFMDCDKIQYQVEKLDSFSDDITPQVDEDANMVPSNQFDVDQIQAGCVALVRVSYPYTFMTPFFGQIWGNYDGNKRIIMATLVFRSEPFDFEVDDPSCSI